MKIGIYGGSFDPIHQGHTNVAQYAIQDLTLDKLIFVPTNISPFKSKIKPVKAQDRLNMINLVLEDKMEVSDFEIKRGGVSYTIDTLKYFKHKYPNDELFLILGSDNLTKLDKWKNIDEISKLAQIVIFKRQKKINKINAKKFNAIILNNPIWDFSSTEFKKGYLDSVDDKVIDYIQAHGLYLEKIIHSMLSAKRAKHCLSTGDFAAELAKKHGLNARQAYLAGIMHDIAKEWELEQSKMYIQEFTPQFISAKRHELHQICGYIWAKYQYKIQDQEILHAILVHTTLDDRENMQITDLDKIVFIADKICQGRRFEGIQKLRELVFDNLNEGFKAVVKRTYQFNINKGIVFDKRQEQIYRKLME